MEQVYQQQQYKESNRKMSEINEFEEEEEIKYSSINHKTNSKNMVGNQFEMFICQNQDLSNSKTANQSSSDSSQTTTSSSLSSAKNKTIVSQNQPSILSCCRHAKPSRMRECMHNTECFEENTTHHNTSQSSLNTSSISCSSTQNFFESYYFTRPPAPSSTSSTKRNEQQQIQKPRNILYEEKEEEIDEIQVPSEKEDDKDNEVNEKKQIKSSLIQKNDEEDEEDNESNSNDKDEELQDEKENEFEDSYSESYQNDSTLNNSYINQLNEEIVQNSHNAKLITQGSSCSIYSLAVNMQQNNCSQQPEIKNIVLKTSFHQNNSQECNSECDKLGKEFFILQKFNGHPYIIQAYSLEHDLELPLLNSKKQAQIFPDEHPRNCCLVMEEATCDLITYFNKRVYETHPHHHYKYLLNKKEYQINNFHQNLVGSGINQIYSSSQFKNSFYNCFPGIFYDILTGLEEVHTTYQLSHNDLKPENMLYFSSTASAKLCDFEHCGSQRFDMKRTDFTYQSPEIVEIYKEYRDFNRINDHLFQLDLFKNDVFSFGVTLFSSMFGFYPFCDEFEKNSKDDLYSLLISADTDAFWQEKEISRICQAIEQNTNSSYLYNFKKFIEETLEENPSNRIDTSSLMNHDFFEEERHYRFEKNLYEQAARQYHQNIHHNLLNKQPISIKNNNNANSHITKSQYSINKFTGNEDQHSSLHVDDNANEYIDPVFFLSPQTKATSIACRNRQSSLENHFSLRRSNSFELKFDPNKSPIQSQQAFTFSPSNTNFLRGFNLNQPNGVIHSYPTQRDQILTQEITSQDQSDEDNLQQQEGNDDEDDKLTKTSDLECNSSKDLGKEKIQENCKQDIDDFFVDEINESDDDEEEEEEQDKEELIKSQKSKIK